ncbi:hypothetical protein MKW94_001589 [Papaver nudicaule]|uniref:TF-B3 domain-containing protein n=1 Tax=Papaver nudicaule TaxID=74823 RepID=A0AA41VKY5_PAPNU|nr:hypothetical protein [Papaver nudicaule]
MANDNSSTCNRQFFTSPSFTSPSPSSFQHKNVVLVQDHEQQKQQQQQQNHKLPSHNSVSGVSRSCVVEVADHESIQKEYMFRKVVTPSDVGKLNRLVIPKQHAEICFPPIANNEKGLLLSFEDKTGKSWTFRYCYWRSSQSYVMTRGWSKFVKEKRLDAGDVVCFGRGAAVTNKDRYYIDWKHQPYSRGDPLLYYYHHLTHPLSNFSRMQNSVVLSPTHDQLQLNHYYYEQQLQRRLLPSTSTSTSYGSYCSNGVLSNHQAGSGPVVIHDRQAHDNQYQQAGLMHLNYPGGYNHCLMETILDSVPVVHGKAAATKRVRLFGVNLECLVSEDE